METPSTPSTSPEGRRPRSPWLAALCGGLVGVLGGLVGLGGAEFRLPLLIGVFHFAALPAVLLNKATSLVVVTAALPARAGAVPFSDLLAHHDVVLILWSGSLVGAWLGAGWATRLRSRALQRILAVLLLGLSVVLVLGHGVHGGGEAALAGPALIAVGALCGLLIGVVASLLGVAGGELLIPTIVLLFGIEPALAGSLSLAVSLPTLVMGLVRYSRDASFQVLRRERRFLLPLIAGSILGVVLGGLALGYIDQSILLPLLALILAVSAVKVWRHS